MTRALAISLLTLTAGIGRAAPSTPTEAPPCQPPPHLRPPDPRCDEALDGRPRWRGANDGAAGRALLRGPRVLSRIVFWPVLKASDLIESNEIPGWLEAITTTDDGLVGVRPELQYATGFIPSVGARLFYRRLPGPGSELMARFRTAGPATILVEVGARGPPWLGLSWGARWSRRHDLLFAGNGPLSGADLEAQGRAEARYSSDQLGTELRWSRTLPGRLSVFLATDLQHRDYSAADTSNGPSVRQFYGLTPEQCALVGLPGDCVDPAELPAFDRGVRIAHLGGALVLDLLGPARDDGGARLSAEASYAHGLSADPSRHVRVTASAVLAIGGLDRALLLRVQAAMVEALAGAPVPFDELITPAGAAGLRGHPDGRFRGPSGVVTSAEYRWYISRTLDASLFADVGTVGGPRFSHLRWDRLFPAFGVGLRLMPAITRYWLAPADRGVQLTYAPGAGFRVLLALAAF